MTIKLLESGRFRGSLLVGLTVLVAFAVSHAGVPLYDGVGFPDEPYRFVQAPSSGKQTPFPASTAIGKLLITNGTNADDATITSNESGPQFALYLVASNVHTSDQSHLVTITATPHAPAATGLPAAGVIGGNYYHVVAVSDSGADVTLKTSPDKEAYVALRLPQGYPADAFVNYRANDNTPWRQLATAQIGNDIYQAYFVGFGDYALVTGQPKTTQSGAVPKKQSHAALIIAAIAVLVVAATILLIRFPSKSTKNHGNIRRED